MNLKMTTLALALCLGIPFGANASIITIGDNADANYNCDIAIGDDASASGGHGADYPTGSIYCSIAAGTGANARGGPNNSAFGSRARAGGGGFATAMGSYATANNWYSTAVGGDASATAQGASAFGSSSSASAFNATANGYAANASHENSVALGANTHTTKIGEVAVGNRQISQVADGTEDTDAINLRQLNAAIAGLGGGGSPYFQANGLNDGFDNAFAVGPRSVAAGLDATAQSQSDTAVGDGAYADGGAHPDAPECAGWLGQATAVGVYANAQGCGSTAQGSSATANGPSATATGQSASATGVSTSAYGSGANATGPYSTAVGAVASARGRTSSAFGNNAQAQGRYASSFGGASWAAENSTALGAFAGASNANAVAIGYNTQTTRDDEVAFGYRLLGQVADGIMDSDAVTVRQLSQVAQYFGGGTSLNGGIWTPPTFALPSGPSFDNVNDALVYLDGRINDLDTGPGSPGPQGPQGPRGEDGRSAYEIAVEEGGFVGTEQEWLESLQGADGQDGAPGRDGVGGSKVKGGSNIAVTDNDDGTQTVALSDNIKLSDQGSVEVGATRVDGNGVSIQGGPSMTRNGVDAGSKRVTNVAPGRIASDSWDAVNGSQLWEMNDRWEHRVDNLDKRISGVCAMGAAQAQAIGAAVANSARRKVSAGIGYCGGQAAMSANMSWDATTPSGSVASFSIGVSSTGDDTSVGAGVSLGW